MRGIDGDAMVGEDGVPASPCGQARHVAGETILVGLGMRRQKRRAVALEAAGAKIGDWILRERMRIVADAAPELIPALPRTFTQRELLRLADDRESVRVRRASRRLINVNRVDVFETLTRTKIGSLFARVRNANFTVQVALLADAVAGARFELSRIDDRSWDRAAEVGRCGAVASLARNSFRKRRVFVGV